MVVGRRGRGAATAVSERVVCATSEIPDSE